MINGKVIHIGNKRLRDLAQQAPEKADQAVAAAAHEGRNRVVLDLQERSPGQTYHRYDPKRLVTAAAEGESPNTDTGNLVNSIQVEKMRLMNYAIIAGAEYAPALELILNRPFMGPMAMSLERDMDMFFDKFLTGVALL
jgi:hypothetical protein